MEIIFRHMRDFFFQALVRSNLSLEILKKSSYPELQFFSVLDAAMEFRCFEIVENEHSKILFSHYNLAILNLILGFLIIQIGFKLDIFKIQTR